MQALLIIDVQNDYFPGGKSELVNPLEALNQIKTVLNRFREAQRPVIFVQHINTRQGATFFIPNTIGVQIHKDIAPLESEPVIVKQTPNSFYQTNLLEVLHAKSISKLVVCGMMTHMCIDTTVRAVKDYGLSTTLLYDACATKDLTIMGNSIPANIVHDAYMAGLNGMFAQVQLVEQVQL